MFIKKKKLEIFKLHKINNRDHRKGELANLKKQFLTTKKYNT